MFERCTDTELPASTYSYMNAQPDAHLWLSAGPCKEPPASTYTNHTPTNTMLTCGDKRTTGTSVYTHQPIYGPTWITSKMTSHTSSTGCALGRLRASRPSPICVFGWFVICCKGLCVLMGCARVCMCKFHSLTYCSCCSCCSSYGTYTHTYTRMRTRTTFIPNSVLISPGMMHETCTFPRNPALLAYEFLLCYVHLVCVTRVQDDCAT